MGKQPISIDSIFGSKIKVKDYSRLTAEAKEVVDYTIKHALKSCRVLKIKRKEISPVFQNLFELEWETIIELRELISRNDVFSVLQIVYGIDEKQFLNLYLYDCFAAHKFVLNEFVELARIEAEELSVEPTAEQKNAGIEMLNRFGYYNNLDFLAGGDILKYDELLKKPYSIIFRKLVLDKTKNEIENNHIRNVSRKTKRY